MTEEEKEAIELLKKDLLIDECWKTHNIDEIFKKGHLYSLKVVLNLIQKQDTEINKLNNVIDRMAKCINAADVNREENVDICKDKGNCIDDCLECKDCIKEYFMKEDK